MAEIESELHDSEDEYNLINEVDILCIKIEKAAIRFDAEMDKAICTSIRAHENREVRIKKGRSRLENLQKNMAASEPENSGGPPGASVVTAACAPCAHSAAQVYRKKTSDKNSPALSYILGGRDRSG